MLFRSEPREIFSFPTARPIGGKGWTPDSRSLIVWTTTGDTDKTPPEAWLYPIDGGTPRKLDLDTSGLSSGAHPIRVNSDGRQIAWPIKIQTGEVSVLENFLPESKTATAK